MGNRSPGYAGPKRHGFSSAFTEPARGKTLAEVTEPCPTCGQLCTLDTYETTINDQRYRVTVFHCPSEKSRRSKNPKIQAQACPRYQRKEKIDVPVLTTSEAAEIRHKAETAGLKIVDLSRRAGMGGSTLGNVLAGRQKIQEAALERVHDVLATAGGGSTVGKQQAPSMAQDLLKMHPENRDRVLEPIAEQALPHYNGCASADNAQCNEDCPCQENSPDADSLQIYVSQVGDRVDLLTTAMQSVEQRLFSVEASGKILDGSLGAVCGVVKNLRNDLEECNSNVLSPRIEAIEARLGHAINGSESVVREFSNRLTTAEHEINGLAKSSEIQGAQLTAIDERISNVVEDRLTCLEGAMITLDREFRKLAGTVTGIDNNLVEARNKITELGGMMRSSDEAFATRLNRMGEMIASQAETNRGNVEIIERLVQAVQGHSDRLKHLEVSKIFGPADPDRMAALEAVASVHCSHRATLSDPNGDHLLWRELRRLNGALESVQERLHDQAGDQADAAARVEFFTLALQAQAARLTILESRPAKNPALVRHFERVAVAVAEQDPGQFAAVVERLLGVSHGG